MATMCTAKCSIGYYDASEVTDLLFFLFSKCFCLCSNHSLILHLSQQIARADQMCEPADSVYVFFFRTQSQRARNSSAERATRLVWAAEVPAYGNAPCATRANSSLMMAAAWPVVEMRYAAKNYKSPGSAATASHHNVNEESHWDTDFQQTHLYDQHVWSFQWKSLP